jgi:hypothetical protein
MTDEFIALAQDTFDPELWSEDDLPLLRAAKEKFEEEQRREEASQADESSSDEWEPEEDCFPGFPLPE